MIPIALVAAFAALLMSGCTAHSPLHPASLDNGPTDSVHYVVVRGGRIVSRTSTWADRSGTTIVRTRSPPDTGSALVTQLRFDLRSGAPVWLRTTGVDARGRVVEERFENVGGVASWASSPESGRKEAVAGSIYRMLEANDVAVDATLAFVEPSIRAPSFCVRPYIAPVLDRLPAGWGRGYVGWTMVEPDSMADVAAAGFANLKKLVRMLHSAGVPVLPGTDDIAGFTLHRELELYVEAGIPAADVLYLATLGSARIMRMDGTLGSITVGKRADMILVDGDPLRAMSIIRRVVLTMKGGALYDPALLYRALAIEPCCPAVPRRRFE